MTAAIRPVRTEDDYRAALERVEALMEADASGPEADELGVLGTLIDDYEKARYPIETPTPLEAIRFRMEQEGRTARSGPGTNSHD